MLFDTHCHLFDEQFADEVEATIERAREAGVRYMVVPAVDVASARRAIALAERYEEIYAAVGIHPESLKDLSESAFTEVEALAIHPKVVAIGEIGLDYYWNVAPREVQKEVFLRQIDIARRVNLPIIIHNRDATEDTVGDHRASLQRRHRCHALFYRQYRNGKAVHETRILHFLRWTCDIQECGKCTQSSTGNSG